MAFGAFKPKQAFHMPSPAKKLGADIRKRPMKSMKIGMPRMRLNAGLGAPKGLKIKL